MSGWRKRARGRRARALNWRPPWLLVAAVISGMSVLAAGTAGPAAAWKARAGSAGSIPAGSVPAFPAGARVIGPAPRSARLHITLALRSRDPDGLTALARQVSTPSSGRYRRFLRPRQVRARFGSSPAAIATLRSWLAQVISSSYGYCEPVPLAGHRGLIDAEAGIFAGMALQGQSMLAASGDAGSEACLPFLQNLHGRAYRLAVGDPASQPYVTGVGGTAIVRYGVPPVQTAWNQTGRSGLGTGFRAPFNGRGGRPATYPGNLAGSGGISQVWRMPRWQRGFDASGNSSGLPCGAVLGGTCREVPDVSALAAGDARAMPGYAIYGTAGPFRGAGWVSVGGTSLASPLWAAFAALADQQVFPHRLGLLSPALYQIDRGDPGAFTDVRAGNNNYLARGGFPANGSCRNRDRHRGPCYQAGAGYDMATGLGSPRAGRLADDLAAGT